jgi:cytochrome c peroxidase
MHTKAMRAHTTALVTTCFWLTACGSPQGGSLDSAGSASAEPPALTLVRSTPRKPGERSPAAELGKQLFFDKNLSASGDMSCATCHDPDHAYGPPNGLAVQLGGPKRDRQGTRAVPSLRYKESTPAYADLLDNPDGISAPGPGGGFTWDGRANTLAEQARLPLLSPLEMANEDAASILAKVLASSYASLFRRVCAERAESNPNASAKYDPEAALGTVTAALQAFQLEDPSFHPYTSKFDLFAGNKLGGTFTPAELRGAKVFSDPKRGNCASCHFDGPGLGGSSGLYTDFSYEAIGVPRNREIADNTDDEYYDLGLCGPARGDHAPLRGVPNAFCGMFKAPTLRNLNKRATFFHNGALHSIEQVIRFYNTRDTRPELWYPTRGGIAKSPADPDFPSYGLITTQYIGGKVDKYDDVPWQFMANIDPQMPLDGRKAGSAPPLTEQNMADLICFLGTLNDDYTPPATPPILGPCVN